MAKSINRLLAELVTATGDVDNSALGNVNLLDSADVLSIGNSSASGTAVFDTLDSLPTSNLSEGQQAFVNANQRLYISNGTGWYNLTLVNRTPTWLTEPSATYDIVDSATPLIVTAKATDSDNSDVNLVNQSIVSDSAQYMVNISNDSSVWTFTPKSADSIGIEVAAGNLTDSNGDFVYTFKWSDGINFVAKASTISYNPGASVTPTIVGYTSWIWDTGSSPSPQDDPHAGAQAGDLAIVIGGFSGFGGSPATNECTINRSGYTQMDGAWGASTGAINYASSLWYKELTSSDLGQLIQFTTSDTSVYTYNVIHIIVVRDWQGPYIQSTALPNDGSSNSFVVQNSGNLPSTVNTNGLLIDVNTTRSGTKSYSTTGIFNMETQRNNQGIIGQAVYKATYADYLSGGYSNMQVRHNDPESYASHSFVISV